tara:strand:- start:5438 stop:5593 length:156 start_codon:yes stop_codon:yes gene_type:complete
MICAIEYSTPTVDESQIGVPGPAAACQRFTLEQKALTCWMVYSILDRSDQA